MAPSYISLQNGRARSLNVAFFIPGQNALLTIKRMRFFLALLLVAIGVFFWMHSSRSVHVSGDVDRLPQTTLQASSSASESSWPTLSSTLKSKTSDAIQVDTVVQMIGRILPSNYTDQFEIVVNRSLLEECGGRDVFVLETISADNGTDQRLRITASTGVSAAAGFQYYLKKYCGGHVSWSGNQVKLPDKIPSLNVSERVVANDLVRYYQNVCTSSYSFVWWNWDRWQREIDWMALNWINLPLAANGQEEIYRRVLLRLNFTQEDLDSFFVGPAFLAWNRMGNIDGWGGPLPDSWYVGQLELQHKILQRMRDFGMTPVLPAFSGHVPDAIRRIFSNVNVTRLNSWNGFNDTYSRTYLLDHRDNLFQTIGKNLIEEMRKEFGVDHVYNSDTFNEMTPPSNDTDYVASVARAVFSSMTSADPEALWLMQGWLFRDPFWTPDLVKALVTSVPLGRMLILDLFTDISPLYQKFDSYYGQPFVFCMLHNFGGTNGLYGAIGNINSGPFNARTLNGSTMVGTGLTPEGIEQNDVMYELMNEMAWRKEPVDVLEWVADYSTRRYGSRNDDAIAAWQKLATSVYNCNSLNFKGSFVMTNRPSLKSDPRLCYDVFEVVLAYELFAKAIPDLLHSDLFMHDCVDVIRETTVAINGGFLFVDILIFYNNKQEVSLQETAQNLSTLMLDLDRMLNTDRRFRLANWLSSARALATDEEEADLYEYNARNQITLWGPLGEIVDYANKQWSGIFSQYYRPRWILFVDHLLQSLRTATPFNQTLFNIDVFTMVEQPFTMSKWNFTSEVVQVESSMSPEGRFQELKDFYIKWKPLMEKYLVNGDVLHLSQKKTESTHMPERTPRIVSPFRSLVELPQVNANNDWLSGGRQLYR